VAVRLAVESVLTTFVVETTAVMFDTVAVPVEVEVVLTVTITVTDELSTVVVEV
jgi:hypothetical protein